MRFRKIETKTVLSRPELIPLVDLAFQMLTFFIIVINFESTRADERIKLPKDMLARPPVVRPEYELVLKLGYQDDHSGSAPSAIPMVFLNDRSLGLRQVGPELEQERRLIERTEGLEALKEVTVLIRGDSELPAGFVQELIKKCQEAGFSKFTLRTAGGESR